MVVDAPDVLALEAQKSNEVGPVAEAGAQLFQMGFTDAEMVTLVLEKHGPDLDACARDLSTLSDWGSLLADLREMGFEDVEKNKRLVVKHNGSLKSTIRELVSDK